MPNPRSAQILTVSRFSLLFSAILVTATASQAQGEDTSPEVGPAPGAVEKARQALKAGHAAEAIALLSPLPLSGPATCVLGMALRSEGETARALLYLERCYKPKPDDRIRQAIGELRKQLRKSTRAPVSLSLSPASATAKIGGAYAADTLLAEDEIWLKPGGYRLEVIAAGFEGGIFAVEVDSPDRMLVPITLEAESGPQSHEIDLGVDAGSELGQVESTPDPRPKKFKTLLAKRYRRAPDPTPVTEAPKDTGPGAWPIVLATGGLVGLGAGIALQVDDRGGPAIASYAAGAVLGGIAVYLLLRNSHDRDEGTGLIPSASDEALGLSFHSRF